MEQTNGRDEIEKAQQNVMEKRIDHFSLYSFFKSLSLPLLSLWKNIYCQFVWFSLDMHINNITNNGQGISITW